MSDEEDPICSVCKKVIGCGEDYFEDEETGLPLCVPCDEAENPLPPCARCGELIGTDVEELVYTSSTWGEERSYHGKCFHCDSCGEGFTGNDSKHTRGREHMWCMKCEAVEKGRFCFKCELPISDLVNGKIEWSLDALDNLYHDDCFACKRCHKPVKSFGQYINDVFSGEPFCPPCYEIEFCDPCAVCNKPLGAGDLVVWKGKTFHLEHWQCVQCGCALVSSHNKQAAATRGSKDGMPLCETCHDENSYPRCYKCQEFITNLTDEPGPTYLYSHEHFQQCVHSSTANQMVHSGAHAPAGALPFHSECAHCLVCEREFDLQSGEIGQLFVTNPNTEQSEGPFCAEHVSDKTHADWAALDCVRRKLNRLRLNTVLTDAFKGNGAKSLQAGATREMVVQEFLETEDRYVQQLQVLLHGYLIPFRDGTVLNASGKERIKLREGKDDGYVLVEHRSDSHKLHGRGPGDGVKAGAEFNQFLGVAERLIQKHQDILEALRSARTAIDLLLT